MNYQDELAKEFRSKLAARVSMYREHGYAKYNIFWLDAMDNVFDKAYIEVYNRLPQGC